VSLNLLDDVLLLNLAFEAAQRVLEGLTLLNSDFRQTLHPQTRPYWTLVVIARLVGESQELCIFFCTENAILLAFSPINRGAIETICLMKPFNAT
jgi:hypothetical protein